MNLKRKLTTLGTLISLSAVIIYIINKFIYFISTLDNFLDKSKGHYYKWRFGRVFYTKQGQGSPILLIHDLSSHSSSHEWHEISEELSKTNTVYALDLLGCGRSDKPNLTYTNYLFVQLITDFIKNVIGDKTDVIATGDSGSFTLMACYNDNDIINKIMLINPSDLISSAKIPTKKTKVVKFLLNMPIIGTLLYNILTTKKSLDSVFRSDYFYDGTKVNEDLIKFYYEASHLDDSKPKYLFSSIKSRYVNVSTLHCLKSISNNIFIVVGDYNSENYGIVKQYSSIIPSSEIISISRTRHLPHLERPQQFLRQIAFFLEG